MLNGGPVTWASKLQKSCAQSTAEAEVIAATGCQRKPTSTAHAGLHIVDESKAITILEDNAACIAQTQKLRNGARRPRSAFAFLQDHVTTAMSVRHCPTKQQLDGFTNPKMNHCFWNIGMFFSDAEERQDSTPSMEPDQLVVPESSELSWCQSTTMRGVLKRCTSPSFPTRG